VVGEPETDASRQHHAPVRTLATIVRQPAEEPGRVGVGLVGLEADGVAAKVDVPSFELRNNRSNPGGRRRAVGRSAAGGGLRPAPAHGDSTVNADSSAR
jgi:hypothetical protein